MLSSFPTPKSYNLGGLLTFQFVQAEGISVFPGIFSSKILLPVSLNSGFEWLNGYSTVETLGFTEVERFEGDGKYYEQTISGFLPGDRTELVDLMQQMDDQYFTLLIKGTNQVTRLVGGFGNPLLFSSSFNSGLVRTDAKGYTFKFYSESLFRAPTYL